MRAAVDHAVDGSAADGGAGCGSSPSGISGAMGGRRHRPRSQALAAPSVERRGMKESFLFTELLTRVSSYERRSSDVRILCETGIAELR